MLREDHFSGPVLSLLALLAILTYLPALSQPLLEDDYPTIALALSLGAPDASGQLAASTFRLRATSLWLANGIWQAFGMTGAAYYCASILLHVFNTWMVYALGCWRPLGYRLAAWAAAFFAIYEGHQEAVMWFTASTELLMFLFGVSSLLCWVRFLAAGERLWYAAALLLFGLSLISKESAVIFAPLLVLPLILSKTRRSSLHLFPFLLLAGVAALLIYESRTYSFRFEDGSFSLGAPFWLVWPLNLARLLWFWGLLALVALLSAAAKRERGRTVMLGLAWMGIGLIPYSFLAYSTRIPSRQTYLASLGLAWIVAAGLLALRERLRSSHRKIFIGLCTVIILHNIGYLWTKKRQQFLERAEPTEQLIALARSTRHLIYVRCFPRQRIIAEDAVRLSAGRAASDLIWDAAEANTRGEVVTFCYRE
ncbi:MAG: glycosyltransferase family 39 protein [Acidobacteria bacterium]|nr:glycosyltransferase family 39 protein [Acidobacteriota bacterium]